jgi:hypothetical protein
VNDLLDLAEKVLPPNVVLLGLGLLIFVHDVLFRLSVRCSIGTQYVGEGAPGFVSRC